jgi:amidophosphoribosyltransferase
VIRRLVRQAAIGHNRYSTTGRDPAEEHAAAGRRVRNGGLALATTATSSTPSELRERARAEGGSIFQSTVDTEVIIHLIAHVGRGRPPSSTAPSTRWPRSAAPTRCLSSTERRADRGARSQRLPAAGARAIRDAGGHRLETCALDLIGAEYVREIEPGEVGHRRREGMRSARVRSPPRPARCVFEYVYFARPDSRVFGRNVYQSAQGARAASCARAGPVEADLVIPVPDSGVPAALGYAEEADPLRARADPQPLRRPHVHRADDDDPPLRRRVKLNAQREVLEGKRVVVVDDSIVRGTTSRKIVTMLRGAGAREVHMRISSPPTKWPVLLRHRHADAARS